MNPDVASMRRLEVRVTVDSASHINARDNVRREALLRLSCCYASPRVHRHREPGERESKSR